MMLTTKASLYEADAGLRREFQAYERDIRISNYRNCAILAAFFMVAGASLDWIVYGTDGVKAFIHLRVISAVMLLGIRMALKHPFGREWHRPLGLAMGVPLMGAIGWMIYVNEGYASPYYAGLNLVLVGAAILMRWPLFESCLVVVLTLGIYLLACVLHGPISKLSLFFNNCYFLVVTGVFTVAGTWFYNSIRFSEFLLRKSLDAQHHQLQDANKQLEESNKKLRELDEAKTRFFANISHELRTPLTLLIAPVETILNKEATLRPEERREMLSTVLSNAMRLLRLINTLLDLARLDADKMEVRKAPVDLGVFINGIASSCRSLALDKHINLTVSCADDLPQVLADAEKLERVCLNLLFNALKFTPAGGSIQMSVYIDGPHVCLEVRDTGVGIAADHLPHLFSRFWQADGTSKRRFQGLGLGLALVKEIVDLHDGMISVRSAPGKGSAFTVRLPGGGGEAIKPGHSKAAAEQNADGEVKTPTGEWLIDLYRRAEFSAPTSGIGHRSYTSSSSVPVTYRKQGTPLPTLLIAEDEPDMMRYLSGQLSADFQVIEARDGQEAVTKAAQFLPDLILSDLMMPYKDGMQVCRELKERASTKAIPIVLLTARPDENSKLEALTSGATDFISKPFSLTEVRVRLLNLAESRRYQKELTEKKKHLEAALDQLKEAESLLVQQEKLNALGRMSAGLIHEINNPLNYACQGVYLLKQSLSTLPSEVRTDFEETLSDIDAGVKRVVAIISDLRSFTLQDQDSFSDFELSATVSTLMRFFSHHQKAGVKFVVDVPMGLMLHGKHGHISQVLMNLVQNAIDATEDKSYGADESPLIEIHACEREERVIITVKDNGSGMDAETKERVFDPFFTTKDVGRGMGLGLSICHRILTDHQARVSIRSRPGEGTEFILDFPSPGSYSSSAQEVQNI